MARLLLKLAGYPWDHITPLLTGDVVPEGIDLQYDVHHGLGPVTDNPSYAGGEASLGRFMIEILSAYRSFRWLRSAIAAFWSSAAPVSATSRSLRGSGLASTAGPTAVIPGPG